MNRLRTVAVALACALGSAASAQTTTVTASHLKMAGAAITTGTVTFTPVNAIGTAIPFADGTGAQNGPTAFPCAIVAGAITGAIQPDGTTSGSCVVPDATQTVPANILYLVQVSNTSVGLSTSGKSYTLQSVVGVSGSTWALDHYGPVASTSNVQAVQLAQGTTTPTSCVAPYFFTNTTTQLSYSCIAGVYVPLASSGAIALTNNSLFNQPTTSKFFGNTDSLGMPIHGGFVQTVADTIGILPGSRYINNIGGLSLPDMFLCDPGQSICTKTTANPYQYGAWPLTFPLGVGLNDKVLLEPGFNDLSNMGGAPTQAQLDYYIGGARAWSLMFGIPDSDKLTAAANCTTTGSGWTNIGGASVGTSVWPAGTMSSTHAGDTMTCTGFNATEAGIIGYKSASSTATYSLSVTNGNGSAALVTDPFTGSTTLNQTSAYTTAAGTGANLYAIGQADMPGGYTSMTLTVLSAPDPVVVQGPWFISPSSARQNWPAVNWQLVSRTGCAGSCSSVGHSDANTNIMRAAQTSLFSELRRNGLNISYYDPNATPDGYNPSDLKQTTKVLQEVVTAGGTGYTTAPILTVTGCSVNPTGHVTISGGSVVTGTFFMDTAGACFGGTPVGTFSGGGGNGAAVTLSTYTDGTHPNKPGSDRIASIAASNFTSASRLTDHYVPSSTTTSGVSSVAAGTNMAVTNNSGVVTVSAAFPYGTPTIQTAYTSTVTFLPGAQKTDGNMTLVVTLASSAAASQIAGINFGKHWKDLSANDEYPVCITAPAGSNGPALGLWLGSTATTLAVSAANAIPAGTYYLYVHCSGDTEQ